MSVTVEVTLEFFLVVIFGVYDRSPEIGWNAVLQVKVLVKDILVQHDVTHQLIVLTSRTVGVVIGNL